MQIDNYQKVRILGEGTYGKCYLAINKTTGEQCVLKQIEIIGLTQQEINESVREAHILEALDSDFIIRFLGSFQSRDGYLNIIMSYAEGGDLSQRIKQAKMIEGGFPEEQIIIWFTQICLAIKHVHDRKIIHRDLKTQNIFLTKDGDVKLGDFGIAKHLQHTIQKIKSVVGTPYYMSPEICENKEYSFKADIWSLGVILLEMCLLKPPFDANSLPVLALRISKGEYFPVPKHYSRDLKRFVGQILQVDPARRPSITEILKNPLIEPRITTMMSKQVRQRQFSHTTLHAINIFDKMPSRGLFIDCNLDSSSSPIESVVSPKSLSQLSSNRHNEMPVKRIDNYMKDQPKLPADKKPKKQEMIRKRQTSEPNLTPKNHMKVEYDRKLVSKGSTAASFQKKKQTKEGMFKKKSKNNFNIAVEVVEEGLMEIIEMKKDIYGYQEQMSQPEKQESSREMKCEELDYIEESNQSSEREEVSPPPPEKHQQEETLLETLQTILFEYINQTDLEELFTNCQKNAGICLVGPCSGLVTLAFAIKNQSC